MRAQLVAHDAVPTDVEDERIKSATLRSQIIRSTPPVLEEDAVSAPVLQDQITVPVLSVEIHSPRLLEPHDVRLGQAHLDVIAAQMAPVVPAGILGYRSHDAIVHEPRRRIKRTPGLEPRPSQPGRYDFGPLSKNGSSSTGWYHGAREAQKIFRSSFAPGSPSRVPAGTR